tara:strand:- start:568 stop:873 length:306 start_codon:yes stop_codon:yes gene_type:complete
MKETIREELLQYIEDCKKDFDKINHFNMFNEDYYVIYYGEANDWLKEHNLGVFEAINICREYEEEHFGESKTKFDDSVTLVNNLVYWYGQDLCSELKIPID